MIYGVFHVPSHNCFHSSNSSARLQAQSGKLGGEEISRIAGAEREAENDEIR